MRGRDCVQQGPGPGASPARLRWEHFTRRQPHPGLQQLPLFPGWLAGTLRGFQPNVRAKVRSSLRGLSWTPLHLARPKDLLSSIAGPPTGRTIVTKKWRHTYGDEFVQGVRPVTPPICSCHWRLGTHLVSHSLACAMKYQGALARLASALSRAEPCKSTPTPTPNPQPPPQT